jgi:hypothetical protein
MGLGPSIIIIIIGGSDLGEECGHLINSYATKKIEN